VAMLSRQMLYNLARCRFDEANVLLKNHKPEGAVYLCGYAIELMLKRKIVQLLDWDGYPDSGSEFDGKASFKVHRLDTLLHFSGLEKKLRADNILYARWQIASTWDSEIRYKEIGKVSESEARDILQASREVLNYILHAT